MKKFLSSLLALTMILSLVIVPARAADTAGYSVTGSVSITGAESEKVNLVKDDSTKKSVTLSVSDSELKLQKDAVGQESAVEVSGTTKEYAWTISGSNGIVTSDSTTNSRIALTAATKGRVSVTCTVTLKGSVQGEDNQSTNVQASKTTASVTINVDDPQGDANAAFKAAIENAGITYKGDLCKKNSSGAYVYFPSQGDSGDLWGTKKSTVYENVTWSAESNTLTASSTVTVNSKQIQVTAKFAIKAENPSLTLTSSISNPQAGGSVTVLSGGELKLTANYVGAGTPAYEWKIDSNTSTTTDAVLTCPTTLDGSSNTKQYTVVCNAKINNQTVASANCTVTVENYKQYKLDVPSSVTMSDKAQTYDLSARLYKDGYSSNTLSGVTYRFEALNERYVKVKKKNDTTATLTLLSAGETYIRVTANYLGRDISVDVPFYGEVHEVTLDEVENGKSDTYSYNTLLSAADKTFKGVSIKSIKVNPTKTTYGEIKDSRYADEYVFEAASGKIGVFTFNVTAYTGNSQTGASYTVTFNIPVTPIKTTYESQYPQPSGTSSNYKYSVAVPDGYESYYVVAKNPDKAPTDYSEKLSGTSSSYSGKSLYTLSGSDFDKSGKCELYVVTYDRKTAYYGVISVYQKSYDIKYSVVAGKSVSFSQKDFDSFLEDIADDAGVYNSRKDTLELSYVKFSLPNSTREGVLYEGKSKIDRNDKVEDLDKVTFESVAKAKDTITISFTAYGKLYKDGASKGKDVDYSGNVVISVVKEDITYTVGIDDTVQLTARDFVNFLQDAKTSYRKAELDYVKFDVSGKNVSSYAYGGLYRSYSSYSTGKLADSTDKFYYEPSRTQYDLADVAYHTTRWAEAGKTVYIPFTVYGTKSGEEASGTMAITIAQTMNFIDVKASDFFYEPVKWAVNNKITNGTSSTTFSPYKNCNRAEIVTFLWRAAGSPEPTVTRNPFTDVNSVRDASYYKAILWASQKGITAGTNATTFSPYQECTRSQIVTFLYRYAGKPSGYYSNPFKDVSSVNEASYYNAILWAVGKGITQGTSTTTFSPYASCTRGEAVTFLYRYVNGVK